MRAEVPESDRATPSRTRPCGAWPGWAPSAGPNFRILWDNAYAVHDLYDDPPVLLDLLACCREAGTEDSVVAFASTSKITRAGAGVAFIAASPGNLAAFRQHLAVQTIGPDKLNQLRHVKLLPDLDAVRALMRRHADIVRPKFERVLRHLDEGLTGAATWTRPRGGYFISVDVAPGTAREVVRLAGEAGVKLTAAGATYPYGRDPDDANIRLAPTYATLEEIDEALPVFITAARLAAVRHQLPLDGAGAPNPRRPLAGSPSPRAAPPGRAVRGLGTAAKRACRPR